MYKKMLLIILTFTITITIYNGYKYYNIMSQIDFNKDIYYKREWKEDRFNCKYYGVNYKKFDIDEYIEEWQLHYSYEYNIHNNINSPKDVIELVLSIFDGEYKSGFDIYYEIDSNRWAIVPIFRNDLEYLHESMVIYVIHDNVLTFYWDGLR